MARSPPPLCGILAPMDVTWQHVLIFLSGTTFIGIIAHAVNTFPMPKSEIGRWFLGVIQYTVGQRIQAYGTMNGEGARQAIKDTGAGK